jgi:hypothetical protein
VRIVELPGLPEKGDVSDWIATGGTLKQLVGLVKKQPDLMADSLAELLAQWGLADKGPHQDDPEPPKESSTTVVNWPESLRQEALYGLAGEWVRAVEPHTEADPAANG